MLRKVRQVALKLIGYAHNRNKLLASLKQIELNKSDNRGYTLLHYVAELGNADLLILLVKNGSNPDAEDHYGQLPLHISARYGHLRAVTALLKVTKNINLQDRYGNSALHLAAKHGDIAIVKKLLRSGALINSLNEHGSSAMALAKENKHHAIAMLLAGSGGKNAMDFGTAITKAYLSAGLLSKFFINIYGVVVVGGSFVATISTAGGLWPSIPLSILASIGLAMVCLERSYREVRNNERLESNTTVI